MLNLNPNYVYFGYDVVLYEIGLRLDKFKGGLTRLGNNERYYSFQFSGSEYPEDMESRIWELRSLNDFHSLNEFDITSGFDVQTNNCIDFIRFKCLAVNHKLLEMVYDDKANDKDMNVVISYIHYVNLKNGKEYVECMGMKPQNDAFVQGLQENGFVAIENSSLFSHINRLPRTKGKKLEIKTESHLERK